MDVKITVNYSTPISCGITITAGNILHNIGNMSVDDSCDFLGKKLIKKIGPWNNVCREIKHVMQQNPNLIGRNVLRAWLNKKSVVIRFMNHQNTKLKNTISIEIE